MVCDKTHRRCLNHLTRAKLVQKLGDDPEFKKGEWAKEREAIKQDLVKNVLQGLGYQITTRRDAHRSVDGIKQAGYEAKQTGSISMS